MKAVFALPAVGLALAGCANVQSHATVDMTGVDQANYARDHAECVNARPKVGFIVGNDLSRCLSAKGYKVLADG